MRLACIYALLDCSGLVRVEHLKAALAVWRYSFDSARHIFGAATGNSLADQTLGALKGSPDGLTKTALRDHFQRNRSAEELDRALHFLEKHGLVRRNEEQTAGRVATRWFATNPENVPCG